MELYRLDDLQPGALLVGEMQFPSDRPSSAPYQRRRRQEPRSRLSPKRITLLPDEDGRHPSTSEEPNLSSGDDAEKLASDTPSVALHRSSYIVLIVGIYASLALTAWILICLLTYGPLIGRPYGY